jgi:hypothetical protein
LLLRLFLVHFLETIDEPDAADDLGKMFGAVEAPPLLLGTLAQPEDYGQRGLARQAALGLLGAQAHSGEGRFDRVCGPDVLPVLGWEVVEGQQDIPVFD